MPGVTGQTQSFGHGHECKCIRFISVFITTKSYFEGKGFVVEVKMIFFFFFLYRKHCTLNTEFLWEKEKLLWVSHVCN